MSRKNPPAKWVLPDVVDPAGRKCIMVQVPDNAYHIAAFRGAMLALASAYNWSDDIAHTAKEVALVWRDIVDAMEWGCEVSGLIDVRQNTESPCILEKTADGDTWEEFANIQLCPPKIRLRGGVLEYSTDGGSTWTPAPEGNIDPTYDPRTDGYQQPNREPVTGQDTACLGSINAVNVFVALHHQVCLWFTEGGLALLLGGLLAGIFLILFSGPLGVAVLVAIAAAIIGYSAGLVDSDFDSTVQNDLMCIFFCFIDADGNFSDSAYTDLLARIDLKVTQEDSAIWHLIQIYVRDVAGKIGLNNAAKTTAITSWDCSACFCGWCQLLDFTVSDCGITHDDGVWVEGVGWQTTPRGDNGATLGSFYLSFDDMFVTSVEITYETTATDPYTNQFISSHNHITTVSQTTLDSSVGTHTVELGVNDTIAAIYFNQDVSGTISAQTVTSLKVRGTGDMLFTVGEPCV